MNIIIIIIIVPGWCVIRRKNEEFISLQSVFKQVISLCSAQWTLPSPRLVVCVICVSKY
jgi:hypothetical protein